MWRQSEEQHCSLMSRCTDLRIVLYIVYFIILETTVAMEKEEYLEENRVSYDLKKWLLRTISSSFVRNRLLVIISPGCTIGFCTPIHQSVCQSINQYIRKSSVVRNRLLVIISPGCTIGFCTSIHQSVHQSINTLANPVLCRTGYWWSSPPAAPWDSAHQSINQNINQSIH